MTSFDAVILAGGSARRLGGVDKMALLIGGQSLLDRAVAAADEAGRTIVVGPPRPVARQVHLAREQPPGGGPAAAVIAGVACVRAEVVVLLAADLPFVDAEVVTLLARAVTATTGAVAADPSGQPQWLLSAWPTKILRRVVTEAPLSGVSLGAVLRRLPYASVAVDSRVAIDCDTPADLERVRATYATAATVTATSTMPSEIRTEYTSTEVDGSSTETPVRSEKACLCIGDTTTGSPSRQPTNPRDNT